MRDKKTLIRQAYERALQRHAEWPTFRFEDAEHALDTVNAIAAKMKAKTNDSAAA